jgi:hypothetical protein
MENSTLFFENGETIDQILLRHLVSEGLIRESDMKKHNAIMLLESSNTSDTFYYNKRPIDRDILVAVMSDVRKYPTRSDIFKQLGFIESDFGTEPNKIENNMRRSLSRVIEHFNSTMRIDLGDEFIPTFKDRESYYKKLANVDINSDEPQEPTLDDISFGKKNKNDRTTKALSKINSEDLLRGNFYADMTKIPKTRWAGWLRFWDREKTSVKDQNRRWKKTFVMGYQIEPNLFYEVWYNSIDSTYTIHEPNGTDVSGRSRSLNEAILNLTRMIAQRSKEDAIVFNGNNPESKQLARSILKSVSDGVDPRVKELVQLDDKMAKQEKAERRMAIKQRSARLQAAKSKLASLARPEGFFGDKRSEDVETDIIIGQNVVQKERHKETAPSGFKKKENQVTPDVVKHYEREMAVRAELDAKRKAQEEADRKEQWKKDFFDNIPAQKGPKTRTEEIMDVPDFAKGYKGSAIQKASDKRQEQKQRLSRNAKKKSSTTEKSTDTKKQRQAEVAAKMKQIRELEAKKIEELNESIEDVFLMINENIGSLDEMDEDFDVEVQELTQNNRYDREMDKIRDQAERSQYTQSVLKQNIMGKIYTYEETRALKHLQPSLFGGRLFTGRKDPIVLPTDKPSLFKRAKMALFGQRFRADFIIGFSLDGKVDVEVWYITEPNPDKSANKDTISTFYVFDVTSGRVLRRYLPYYRNALPIVMAKIGVM